ncbi:MAG: DUF3445 domain-containing protein [Rhodospirillaceae bacterium]|nr:DUF3445 domain-containing protein [Rhodospirillaceae bacterium]
MTGEIDAAKFHPVRMGLEPLALEDWLKPQVGDQALLPLRARLAAEKRDDVLGLMPEGAAAVAELAAFLHQRGFGALGAGSGLAALAAIAGAVAEDLCILTPHDGQYRLTAGVLCFPNRWRLREKMGANLLAVHGPVPDYADKLAEGVDRFLARLRPLRAYIRDNWGLASVPDLHLPDPVPPVNPAADETFYVRGEAQAFLKLPGSGAVIFSIRTTITPWAEITAARKAGIAAVVKELSRPWLDYKSLTRPENP